jgi:hypothetical protein
MPVNHISGSTSHFVLIVLLGIMALTTSVNARIYYVATDGDNGYPGTIDFPWRTISYAVGSSSGIVAGDTIAVRGGNYPEAVSTFSSLKKIIKLK